jgi:hypothetical protein
MMTTDASTSGKVVVGECMGCFEFIDRVRGTISPISEELQFAQSDTYVCNFRGGMSNLQKIESQIQVVFVK